MIRSTVVSLGFGRYFRYRKLQTPALTRQEQEHGRMDVDELRKRLREWAGQADETSWPDAGLGLLTEAGCWENAVGAKFGGRQVAPKDRLRTYEAVAWESLTLALILTQHDGACELLADCDNTDLAQQLLPRFAAGKLLTTVGISQLTTSRRGVGPALRAERAAQGYRLTGLMPWVTSAAKAHYIVTGAVLDDDRQILACLPTDAAGLTVKEPMELLALSASWTSEVRCDGVLIQEKHLMRGPVERALARRAPAKPLTVSSCGMGLAGALLEAARARQSALPDAKELIDGEITRSYDTVRKHLYSAAETLYDDSAEIPATAIRLEVNDLVTRLAISLMTLLKGSGYLACHPTQRLVREALFFLVWSAPPAVQMGALRSLWSSATDAR